MASKCLGCGGSWVNVQPPDPSLSAFGGKRWKTVGGSPRYSERISRRDAISLVLAEVPDTHERSSSRDAD